MKTRAANKIFLSISIVAIFFAMKSFAQESANPTSAPTDQVPTPAPSGATSQPSSTADAKSKTPAKGKKTTIDFEDQLIEGSRQKPELFYLLQNKDFNYKRLIRLREDFLPELRKSGEDIQGRPGSAQ